jgi:predicted RNA polymerase sigma factor
VIARLPGTELPYMLRCLGPKQEAHEAYGAALELVGSGPERCLLEGRLAAIQA